jgi:hypothetical protein
LHLLCRVRVFYPSARLGARGGVAAIEDSPGSKKCSRLARHVSSREVVHARD